MDEPLFVYTTYPSLVEAEKAGRALTEAGLAACVNILPNMVSIYRWQGKVERAEEVVMIVKTRVSLKEKVAVTIKGNHSYDTPAIVFLATAGGDADYSRWILDETAAAS